MSKMSINTESGYKANEWKKDKDGKQLHRIYIEGPNGALGHLELTAGSRNQGQFVPNRDSNVDFGIVSDANKTKVTLTAPGGASITLGPTGRTDQTGKVLSREDQITMGMCMNNAGRLLPHMHDLKGKSDEDVADLMVNLAQTIFDRYL
jgi:hypothetical protein